MSENESEFCEFFRNYERKKREKEREKRVSRRRDESVRTYGLERERVNPVRLNSTL